METLDLQTFIQLVVAAAQAGKWAIVPILGLIGVIGLANRFLVPRLPPFWQTPAGKKLVSLVLSVGGALLTSAAALQMPTWPLLGAAVGVWFTAIGGLPGFVDLVSPWLVKVLPGWLVGLFAPRGDAITIEAKAKVAGLAAAVGAKSPTPEDIANAP